MSVRINNKWTPELLAQCRGLYENGTPNQALGAMFDIKPATIAVMAWQNQWRRQHPMRTGRSNLVRPLPAKPRPTVSEINPPIPPSRDEIAFNTRLARMIAAYWQAQGKRIDVQVQTMGCGIQCIRSRSRNGIPSQEGAR